MTFHEKVLDQLLIYRKSNPDFNFISRQRNSKNKLESGIYFQGNESYAFVGLIDRSGGLNKTRSVGLVFTPSQDEIKFHLEIVHKGEKDTQLLNFYSKLRSLFLEGIKEIANEKSIYDIGSTRGGSFEDLFSFLDIYYSKIKSLAKSSTIDNLIISNEKFEKIISKINKYRLSDDSSGNTQSILVNITWNSKDWKEPSEDTSNHAFVKEGNTPGESWNFDKEAKWNDDEFIYGYAQFTNPPTISNPPIIVFYSDGKIVGFYGNAEVSDYDVKGGTKNLSGDINLSFVLKNKIKNIKSKGFLEDKERIGQIGFIYLKKKETIIDILNEALHVNPNQSEEINNLKNWYIQNHLNTSSEKNKYRMQRTKKLNQLFYGPPGTGKTYNTISEAIKIVDYDFYRANKENREILTKRYQELLITDWKETKGQIAFCTFHQSFTYEDFVEGIKPKTTPEKQIYYDIEPGIFKKLCDQANSSKSSEKVKSEGKLNWSEKDFKDRKAFFYKLSLGEANNPEDREIYEYCRDNDYISIGFGGDFDYSGMSETEIRSRCDEIKDSRNSAGSQLSTFIHGLSVGDYVVVSKGNKFIRALGQVIGEYEYHSDYPIGYSHFRKVKWVFVDESIQAEELYDTSLMQRTIYKMDHDKLRKKFFVTDTILNKEENESKPYIIIIDEINRGNVASIFGELITLIEPDKRSGADEVLNAILPYSKEKFSVPDNVYIIGTMNTADRSIEALDSALRRRFDFIEMMPDYKVMEKVLGDRNHWEGIIWSEVLKKINTRITRLIDRDHQLGHSYFLGLKGISTQSITNEIKNIFSEKVIPLLQEYFFNDFNKIGMVIGEDFLIRSLESETDFAKFDEGNSSDYDDIVFDIVDPKSMTDDNFKLAITNLLN